MKSTETKLDVLKIRNDFPGLDQLIRNKPLIYLDNGATSQKPKCVVDAMDDYYLKYASNVHRAVHALSDIATRAYEQARKSAAEFLNAPSEKEVIFTKGTTDGMNLLAHSFGSQFLKEGDEIILSGMEHHSGIVPWQMICEEKKATIRVIPITEEGDLDLEALKLLFNERTRIVSIVHISNALGTVNPVKEIISLAHSHNVPVALDGAQCAPHLRIDVQDLDCDFYLFSAHKVFGPTGAGVLFGKEKWLEQMPPYQGGGDMIKTVTFEKTTYNDLPFKFEAGTPNVSGVIGMGEALRYFMALNPQLIHAHEQELLKGATQMLSEIEGLRIIGTAKEKVPVLSLHVENIHPADLGTLLDMEGIAVRAGHHCTQPLMQRFKLTGTCRASFAFYNTLDEAAALAEGVKKAIRMLR